MSKVMEWLENMKKEQLKRHHDRIEYVRNHETPQHVLASKEVADALITEKEERYIKNADGFFFTERLVNRLMHLMYLTGRADIDERSFEMGYQKAMEEIRKRLEDI